MFHTWSWVAWLAAAAVPAFTLRNPLYYLLILGAAWIVYAIMGRATPIGRSWGSLIKVGTFFFALTIPFTALSIHIGRIILFRLPSSWPIVGGAITLEAIIAGAVSGLGLLTILIVFAAFNAVVDHYQLLRATPSFLLQAGVVVTIAISFIPQLVLSAKDIREAQRIRGHRFRGVRDLLPLVLPLLANSLERAIQLAETMEARGFASTALPVSRRNAVATQLATLASLLGLLAGLFFVAYLPAAGIWGWVLIVLSVVGLLATFAFQSRRVKRTRYRRPAWTWRDTALVCASALVLAVVVAAKLTDPAGLIYSPYPPNSLLPPFNPLVGAALLLLAAPALLAPRSAQPAADTLEHQP